MRCIRIRRPSIVSHSLVFAGSNYFGNVVQRDMIVLVAEVMCGDRTFSASLHHVK